MRLQDQRGPFNRSPADSERSGFIDSGGLDTNEEGGNGSGGSTQVVENGDIALVVTVVAV